MIVNDTTRNGRSKLQAELEDRRFWVWESAIRGLGLSKFLSDKNNAEAAGLRFWESKEQEQRNTFNYSHLGERLQYRRPDNVLEKLNGFKLILKEQRLSGEAADPPPPPVSPKEWDGGVIKALVRLELVSRFPWRARELFGWDDQVMLNDDAEQMQFSQVDFSTQPSIQQTIVNPIMGAHKPDDPKVQTAAKSAYWLNRTRDVGNEENPPLEHISLMKDTADFGANYFLRLLYLFGPLPAHMQGKDNPIFLARQKRRSFDEAKFTQETIKEWKGDRTELSQKELEAMQNRLKIYLERLKDPIACDLRFSSAVTEIIKQALLRFKYWIDEPFFCKDNDKLHAARKERKIAEQEEMVFWSENHYVLFATAEFLAGQLWPKDLFVPGRDFQDQNNLVGAMIGDQRKQRARQRLLKWLNHRIMLGWSEWNAPGYYKEHAEALYNLVDFCLDEEIQTKASIALDLLAFDVARLNHKGSFGVTGARAQSKFKICGWQQSLGDWIEFLFGLRGAFAHDPSELAVIAAGSSYQVPDVILEIGSSEPKSPIIDMSRVSTHFNEAHRYGIGTKDDPPWISLSQMTDINHKIATTHQSGYNQADDDTVFWWGRSAYFNKQVINSTVRLIEKYRLEETNPFKGYGELFGGGMNTGEDLLATLGSGVGIISTYLLGANPIGIGIGAAAGAFGASNLIGKGILRPAIVSGRIGASAVALMAMGPTGLLLSIPIAGWPFGDDKDHADDISVFVEGSTLSRASLYTWRDRGAMLSSTLDFRPSQLNFQSNFCQATLSAEASVWTTSPFSGAPGFDPNHVDGPGWWTGYWSSPRVVQFQNAAIIAYRPNFIQNRMHDNASHCWLPREAFLDFVEGVRPSDVEGDDDGSWAFGKVIHPNGVEGYIGVYSARDADFLNKDSEFYRQWYEKEVKDKMGELAKTEGDQRKTSNAIEEWRKLANRWAGGMVTDFFANKDLYAEDDNIWIIQVGSSDEFGSFQKFKDEVTAARIHIDFGDMQCSYDIPRRGRLELHTDIDEDDAREKGRFRFKGNRLVTDYFPRYSSPFVRAGRVEWGQPRWALQWGGFDAFYSLSNPAAPVRILNAEKSNEGEKRLVGLAIRIRTEHEDMDEDSIARATVRLAGREIVSRQIVARGEVLEHSDHDVEWMFFDAIDGTQPLTIEINHGPSEPSGDDDPHWRMRFDVWALTEDSRLLPCKVDFSKARNFNARKVNHLNFEDEHRSSGPLPVTIEDL